jgi:CheY-like chemotaxis protein
MERTILLVDDDQDIVASLQMLLAGEGFIVRTAFDGAAALESALETPPDLIICDLSMPIMDGRIFIGRLRQDGDRTPVILMSAVDLGTLLPGVDFLAKPFDVDHLLRMVQRLIDGTAG